jgi:hypothetical protein
MAPSVVGAALGMAWVILGTGTAIRNSIIRFPCPCTPTTSTTSTTCKALLPNSRDLWLRLLLQFRIIHSATTTTQG